MAAAHATGPSAARTDSAARSAPGRSRKQMREPPARPPPATRAIASSRTGAPWSARTRHAEGRTTRRRPEQWLAFPVVAAAAYVEVVSSIPGDNDRRDRLVDRGRDWVSRSRTGNRVA